MPSKTPDGKRLSGAAQAKRKKQAREHDRRRADDAAGVDPFAALPAPPISDVGGTAGLITWGAKALALTMDRAMRARDIFEGEAAQLRFIADCAAKLGMIRDKAAEQDKIQKVASAMGKGKKSATKGEQSLAGVQWPETARRIRSVAESGKPIP